MWATYSVVDHLPPPRGRDLHELAADIVLFDRLVFPVPEEGIFPENSGFPHQMGPVEWKRDESEWSRWEKNGWDPQAQQKLLEILEPVTRKVHWNSTLREEWRIEAAKEARPKVPESAFIATKTVLTRDLPADVRGVATIGPSYPSFEEMQKELHTTNPKKALPDGTLAAVIGWEFLVPDSSGLSGEKLLEETVAFATGNNKFRSSRSDFIEWQQKFLRGDSTDIESIERAIKDMREMMHDVEEEKRIHSGLKMVLKPVVRLLPASPAFFSAVLGLGDPILTFSNMFLTVVAIGLDNTFMKDTKDWSPDPTAFVYNAREHFIQTK